MKLPLLLRLAVLTAGLAVPIQAAKPPPAYANERGEITYNYYRARTGNWDNARNWSLKKLPDGQQDAIVRDDTAVLLKTEVPTVRVVGLGGKKTSTLTVAHSGVLVVAERLHVNRNENDTVADLYLEGGRIRVGADESFANGTMHVGTSTTASTRALFQISEGTFEGGTTIGAVYGMATGLFRVIGSKPVVRAVVEKRDGFTVEKTGVLEFVMDADGIATLDYAKTFFSIKEGGVLRVDGKAYTGRTQTFTLVQAGKIFQEKPTVEAVNFSADYKAEITLSAKAILLKIRKR